MSFHKGRFALFFSLPLGPSDWANLDASHVRLAMLVLDLADAATLARLHSMGVRVILRVNEGAYQDDLAPLRIRNRVLTAMQHCGVEACIIGNEPENAYSFEYGSPSWGQDQAYTHRRQFDAVRVALQGVGARVVSPAQTMRSISEGEPAQPGKVAWREICCLPDAQGQFGYLSADYNGVHLYGYGWEGYVDELRFLFALKEAENLWHKSLYIDEVGIAGKGTPLQKMRAYIDIAELLLTHPLGKRVEFLCPFCSNGNPGDPPAWDARFLLNDPACYVELGKWMTS